jgi:glycosyltransferase involved in cell wall biosynthesis
LRVLVDAASVRIGGTRTYARAQLAALDAIPGIELTVFTSRAAASELAAACPNATVRECPRGSLTRRILWEQLALPVHARGHDVIFTLGNFALFLARRPQVVASHNMSHFTEHVRRFRRKRYPPRLRLRLALESAAARASVKRAERVVAVSQTMRAAIEGDLGAMSHIRVIPSASPDNGRPGLDERNPLPVPPSGSYVLAVAHDYPHKDWDGLVATFARRTDLPALVLVGACRRARLRALSARLEAEGAVDRVWILGRVDQPQALDALYRHASCHVAHSFYESFGFTVCEALLRETPIAAADIPAYREVCGDVAAYYPPADQDALVEAIHRACAAKPSVLPDTPAFNGGWASNAAALAQIFQEVGRPARQSSPW